MKRVLLYISLTALALYANITVADVDLPTKFSNSGGIINTRHNMTQSTIGAGATVMNPYRNDYEQVCVYCHTPHGASGAIDAPLWNRTLPVGPYTTYEQLNTPTINGTITQPGINSLTCLSCHDGTLGIDSIINMPGSGNYSADQELTQNNAFLDTWDNSAGADATVHIGLDAENIGDGCLACHDPAAGIVGAGATDFRVFALGTDLRDDHPIGVNYPTGARIGTEFNATSGLTTNLAFFDNNGNGRADGNEIRLYDTGQGPEVECASCHDPHGVSSTGSPDGTNFPTFLRATNSVSNVCLTCHIK